MSKVLLGLSQAIVQYALGLASGSLIDAAFSSHEGENRTGHAAELAAQVAVNGLSLGLLSKYVLTLKFFDDDPTGGIMFILGFTHGQTNMLIKATSASFGIKQALERKAAAITKE
eukprot:tig00020941_g16205.t1